MQFLDLFLIALMPVLKVILITALGLFLALDRIDLLGINARHHLNNLVFYVLSPAIISSYLADTITLQSLATMWFMPVNIFLTFLIGSALGWILVKIIKTPEYLSGLVIATCSAGNIGNLFLIILPALCEEQDSPFGDSTTCSTDAEAYASLSMAILSIYLWTYIYFIMRVTANNEIEENDTNSMTISVKSAGETSDTLAENFTEPLLLKGCPSSEEHSDQIEVFPHTGNEVTVLEKINHHVHAFTEKIHFKKILAPSTIAAILGLIIGMVSPIRKAMIGDSAPLRVIYSSVSFLGEAAIPCITLIVGANLLTGLKRRGVGPSVVIGIIAVKFIALPLLGIGVVKAAERYGNSNVLGIIFLPQLAGTITQLVQTAQSECSVVMLWTYSMAALFLTLWSAFFMWLVA